MFPVGYGNVSAGNVTAYCTVFGSDVFRLSGATVNMAYADPVLGQVNNYGITDESGMVSFVVPNNTVIYFYASKEGYREGGTTVNSGTGSGGSAAVYTDVTLQRSTVTTAPTATTLPGGGTPGPTLTYLPNCDPDLPNYDAAKCRTSKGGMGLNILADNIEGLVWLCLIVTMLYLLKGIGK
jgi:hypothetical protein